MHLTTEGTNGKLTFQFTAGALVRRKLCFELETFCEDADLNCSLRESRGLLESDYYVKITGPVEKVRLAKEVLEKWEFKTE